MTDRITAATPLVCSDERHAAKVAALTVERDEARQHAAAISAQRDRLRKRMNNLADRWEHALAVDEPYARALRAEISVAPFDPEGSMAVQEYTEHGRRLWAFRCWGTDTCDGWLGLGHYTQTSALQERERHVVEMHAPPAAAEATDHTCTDSCRGVTGIRGLLEHVGIDTRGQDITVNGRVVESATSSDTADNPERCCVCGGGSVTYHNVNEQPFCEPCANCPCGQDVCVRTGINDPAVSPAATERGRIASVLAEVLAVFTTRVSDEPGGRVVAYLASGPVRPDDMDRWRAALTKEQP